MISPDTDITVCKYTTDKGFSYLPVEVPNLRSEFPVSVTLYSKAADKIFVAAATTIKLDTGEIVEITARGRVIYEG